MKLAIGADHGGYNLKQYLIDELKSEGHNVIDCGTDDLESVDYPDYAGKVCKEVNSGNAALGILICTTGIGISIAANKMKGIRAALCHTGFSARLARQHNDANVICLGGGFIGNLLAKEMVTIFINEEFSKGERHRRRVDKMNTMDKLGC